MTKLWILDRNEEVLGVLQNRGTPVILEAVHREQLNGENVLEFAVPADSPKASLVVEENIVLFKDLDGNWQEFVIRQIEDEHGEQFIRRAYCEHAFTELNDYIIRDIRPENRDAVYMLERILEGTRWRVGQVTVQSQPTTRIFYNKSALECIYEVIELFGGELQFRTQFTGNKITGRYVDLLTRRGTYRGKRYVHGKDVVGVKRFVDTTNLATALIGRGKGVETEEGGYGRKLDFTMVEWRKENGDPVDKPLGQDWVGTEEALQQFGRPDGIGGLVHRERVIEFEDEEDPVRLLERTWEAYKQMSVPVVSYELDVINLETVKGYEHELVRLGDDVDAIDRKFNPELRLNARVLELERNLLKPEENKVVLGNIINLFQHLERQLDLEERVKDKTISTSWLDGIIDALNNQIRAGGGKIIITNEGQLILNELPENNPTKAILINPEFGIAISNTREPGGDPATVGGWRFTSFITGDGVTANLINTGELTANRIRSGNLTIGGRLGADGKPINGQIFMVNDQDEITMHLDGNFGGAHEFNVGFLKADNVWTATTAKQEKQINRIYVNATSGNDILGDGSESKPYKTIQRAVDQIPKNNNAYWEIYCKGNFMEHLTIRGYSGDGVIKIIMRERNDNNSWVNYPFYGWVKVLSCNHRIDFVGGYYYHDGTNAERFTDELAEEGYAIVHVVRSSGVFFQESGFYSQGNITRFLVAASQNSYLEMRKCAFIFSQVGSQDIMEAGVRSHRGSTVFLYDCYGTVEGKTGLLISTGGIGVLTGDDPSNVYMINGGNPGSGYHPDSAAVRATRTGLYLGPSSVRNRQASIPGSNFRSLLGIMPLSVETWRLPSGGNVDDGVGAFPGLTQGAKYYPNLDDPDANLTQEDYYGHNNVGFIWFSDSDLNDLTGKDFDTIRLSLKREAIGIPGKVSDLKIYAHSLSYPEGGLSSFDESWNPLEDPDVNLRLETFVGPFDWNEKIFVDLSPFKDEFKNGTIKGFVLFNDYTQYLTFDEYELELEAFWQV